MKRDDIFIGDRSGQITVRYDKGGGYREVPLTRPVRKALLAYLKTQPDLTEKDLLWVGERGPLKDRGSVLYMLKKYAFQAGLDERLISPHVLRHTLGRPFGRLINASMDAIRHQRRISSPWRFNVPSHVGLVSFQGT